MTHLCQKFLLLTVVTTFLISDYSLTSANDLNIPRSSDLFNTNNGNSGDLADLEDREAVEWPWSIDGDPVYIDDNQPNDNIYLGSPNNITIFRETNQLQLGEGQRVRFLFPLTD
ncbi:MAG: hypothetical protein AAGF26_19045 [Cyanobacteria bacterium P01_G01_bin.49]